VGHGAPLVPPSLDCTLKTLSDGCTRNVHKLIHLKELAELDLCSNLEAFQLCRVLHPELPQMSQRRCASLVAVSELWLLDPILCHSMIANLHSHRHHQHLANSVWQLSAFHVAGTSKLSKLALQT
jgi:hypothetical protein